MPKTLIPMGEPTLGRSDGSRRANEPEGGRVTDKEAKKKAPTKPALAEVPKDYRSMTDAEKDEWALGVARAMGFPDAKE